MNFININKLRKNKFSFDKPGQYLVYFENLSEELIFEIKTSGVDLKIYGLYQGRNQDNFNLYTIQHHQAPSSSSYLLVKGVFEDSSSFFHQGLIRIEKSAQKSSAYQKNQNLVLSKNVFVDSKPQLEILANDVFCTHGSTTGFLNQDQVYYLNTRGLSKTKAKKLLVDGFLNEIKEKINQYD